VIISLSSRFDYCYQPKQFAEKSDDEISDSIDINAKDKTNAMVVFISSAPED